MFKKFTTKELIFIALSAAMLFVVNFAIGSWIIAITGVPGASGFITGITNLLAITIVCLVLRKFGSITLMYFIYSIISLPTPMNGGSPGLIWKIPAMVVTAFILDIILYLFHYKKKGFIIGLPAFEMVGLASYILMYYLLDMPELDKLIKAWLMMVIAILILGAIGIWLGFVIYNKIKNKQIIKQLRE